MTSEYLAPGATVASRFVLERQLGAGGYGTVWSAKDRERGGAVVALKILHENLRDLDRASTRFRREAELLSSLDHPRLVRALACDLEGEPAYIAMELAPGRTLMEELRAVAAGRVPIPPQQEIEIFEQICSGVDYAHGRGFVHRDLKPANVMIERREGQVAVKVLDFGVAKLLDASSTSATTLGRRLGALFYMSPEQALGEELDLRSDIFSLGSIFYEVLTLQRAWAYAEDGRRLTIADKAAPAGNGADAVLRRMTRLVRPRVSEFRPGLGEEVDRVIARAMAVKASERFASVRELSIALGEALQETLKSARPPTLLWKRPPVSSEQRVLDVGEPEVDLEQRPAVMPRSWAGDLEDGEDDAHDDDVPSRAGANGDVAGSPQPHLRPASHAASQSPLDSASQSALDSALQSPLGSSTQSLLAFRSRSPSPSSAPSTSSLEQPARRARHRGRARSRRSRWLYQLALMAVVGAGGFLLGRIGLEQRASPAPPAVEATPVLRPSATQKIEEPAAAPRPEPEPRPAKARELAQRREIARDGDRALAPAPKARDAADTREPVDTREPAADRAAGRAPATAAPSNSGDEFDPLLARLKNGDLAALGELKRRIVDAARTLDEGPLRTSIERRAIAGGAVGDATALEACIRDLRTARKR